MKTPDEIKKGLRNAKHVQCMGISDGENENAGTKYGVLVGYVLRDAIYIYITQLESGNESKQKRIEELESRLAQVERERDAAVNDVCEICYTCKHRTKGSDYCEVGIYMDSCECNACGSYEWRGVCDENTKDGNEGKA